MYQPKHFTENDIREAEALVREFGFATLVSVQEGLPLATHIPLELTVEEGIWKLHGHIARANPQWRNFSEGKEVLAIFMGPHSYVSPSWYNHKNVPTWNYRAVQLYGTARILEGAELEEKLRALMQRYETAHAEKPLRYEEIPASILQQDLRGLIGIEIAVTKMEAARKYSQNRDAESHANIVKQLKKMDDYNAQRVADEMQGDRE